MVAVAFAQQKDWTIVGHSSKIVRHEVVMPGSCKVEGQTVAFL
jgi:hypothetical protein